MDLIDSATLVSDNTVMAAIAHAEWASPAGKPHPEQVSAAIRERPQLRPTQISENPDETANLSSLRQGLVFFGF
jgi:hypothetical protein